MSSFTDFLPVAGVGGSGTANYIPKWSNTNNITDSVIYDDGTNVGIGTSSPSFPLDVYGGGGIRLRDDANLRFIRIIPANSTATNAPAQIDSNSSLGIAINVAGSERMRIDDSGRVGIGTSSPANRLHVVSTTGFHTLDSVGVASLIDFRTTGNTTQGGVAIGADATNTLSFRTASTERMVIDSSGNVGIGSIPSGWRNIYRVLQINTTCLSNTSFATAGDTMLSENVYVTPADANTYIATGYATQYRQVNGQHIWYSAGSGSAGTTISFSQRMIIDQNGLITGDFNDTSDISKKENINDLVGGLNVISGLRPVSYQWKKEEQKGDHIREGFIAQEVEQVMPRAVFGEEGNKSIDVTSIVSHLTKAVQELKAEIETLKAQINN